MTYTELKAEAEKTKAREAEREEANLLYNIRHARDAEDRRRAKQAYEVWCRHVRSAG